MSNFYKEGDAHNAARLLKKVLKADPGHVLATCRLALLNEFELSDLQEAERLYRRAMTLGPDDVSLVYDFAVFQQERYLCIHICIYMYYMYTYIHVCISMYICICISVYVYVNDFEIFQQERRNDYNQSQALYEKALAMAPADAVVLHLIYYCCST
jgi:Tfp pilus assembly protein PilF